MSDSDDDKKRAALEVVAAFNDSLTQKELAVLRKRVAALLANLDQTASAEEHEAQILLEVAAKMNDWLAAMADHFPDGATALADLLRQWKDKHRI
jgi:hypothetical protein